MTKRVQWKCPNGKHPGILGPFKPRRNNIVRYCLRCSEEAGVLVERVAPAVEKSRTVKATKAAERRQRSKEREQAQWDAYYTVAGINLFEEMKRLVRLKAFGGRKSYLARNLPTLKVRRASQYPRSTLGHAWWYANRIQVVDYPGIDSADVRETLLHELVHLYESTDESGRHHGRDFKRKMREAFREAYGVVPYGAIENVYHGRYASALREHEKEQDAAVHPRADHRDDEPQV